MTWSSFSVAMREQCGLLHTCTKLCSRTPGSSVKVKNFMQFFPVDNGFYFSIFLLVSVGIAYWDFYFEECRIPLPISHRMCIQFYDSGPLFCQSQCGFNKENIYIVLIFCSGGYFIHLWKACKLLKPPLIFCNWMELLILV